MRLRLWTAEQSLIARSRCQYLRLELPEGLSKAQAAKAIRLQLQRLDGSKAVSFAWRAPRSASRSYGVWFWRADADTRGDFPEPLMFSGAELDGASARRCALGCELNFFARGELFKTRWLAAEPSEAEWQQWLDECGIFEPQRPGRSVRSVPRMSRLAPGWNLERVAFETGSVSANWKLLAAACSGSAIVGAALMASWQLHTSTEAKAASVQELEKLTGEASAIQRQIDSSLTEARKIAAMAPSTSQMDLLANLAKLKLLGGPGQPVLVEWDVRGDSIRMQLARPNVEYRLNELLAALEREPSFKNIRLVPNPPAGMIVIQAQAQAQR